MPMGNETNHVMDGLTVRGGLQIGADGPFLAPNTMFDGAHGNWRTPGIEVPHRRECVGSVALTSQTMRFTFFTAPFNYLSSTCEFGTGSAGAAATPTLIRYGLYLIDQSTQGLTLVASTTTDLTLLVNTNTRYAKAWDTPYTLLGGRRYGVAPLVVSSQTMPNLPHSTVMVGNIQNLTPLIGATLGSQSDLPATIANSALSNTTTSPYVYIS